MKILPIVITLYICSIVNTYSQMYNANWAFGDSAGINFYSGSAVADTNFVLSSTESSASISDSIGNLLFYVGTENPNTASYWLHAIWDSNHTVMPNGDSIMGNSSMAQGSLILPFPDTQDQFFVFTIHRNSTGFNHLFYSIVDMSLNSGFGDVTLKNVQLDTLGFSVSEQMTAVRHGNGRDWWLLTHRQQSTEYCKFLISDAGISGPIIQQIGSRLVNEQGMGSMKISENGEWLCLVGIAGIIDLFNFNRCSGQLFNWNYMGDSLLILPGLDGVYACSFSPNNELLYISSDDSLFQYNLNVANIKSSKSLIFSSPCQDTCLIGQHLLGLDGKIYIANSVLNYFVPNQTAEKLNISFIESPNTLGFGCGFTYLGFNLGGRSSIFGLPNLPNYNLGRLIGSACDTLFSGIPVPAIDLTFEIYPNPNNGIFQIKYTSIGEKLNLQVFNILGDKIYSQQFPQWSQFQNINIPNLGSGLYFAKLSSSISGTSLKFIVK